MADLDDDDEPTPSSKKGAQGAGGDDNKPEYEVGYGKPPVAGQFAKGNKKGGRKKGSKGIKSLVNEAFDAKAPAKINGKAKKLSKKALALHQLANKASSGDMKAIERAIPLLERYGPQEDPDGPSLRDLEPDMEALRLYLCWYDLLTASDNDNEDDERIEGEADRG